MADAVSGFTHFCSKPSISLSSRIFSSGSHVLCLNKDELRNKYKKHKSYCTRVGIMHIYKFILFKTKCRYTTHLKGGWQFYWSLTSLPILSISPGIQVVPATMKQMVDKQKQLATWADNPLNMVGICSSIFFGVLSCKFCILLQIVGFVPALSYRASPACF